MSDVKEKVKNKLKNLLKHNYPFTMIDEFNCEYEIYNPDVETICFIYETEEIPNTDAINAKTVNDMHNILKPTIKYFKSLRCYTEKSDYYYGYSYGIFIKFFKENGLLEHINLMHLFYDKEGCIMDHLTFICEKSFQKYTKRPFSIHLNYYEKDEQEHESESENENEDEQEHESENENEDEDEQEHESENEDEDEEEEIPIIKTFKEDKCIICLENEPNILYVNCRHIYLPVQNVNKLRI